MAGEGYYSDPGVRARMGEYIKGARYISGYAPSQAELFQPRMPSELANVLDRNGEVYRSLWDEDGLVAILDLEYVEFARPVATYQDPEQAFLAQAPVLACLQRILEEHGLSYRSLMTGRGYHLVWRISRTGLSFERLRALGQTSASLEWLYDSPHRPLGKRVSRAKALAFSGLGMVLEYLGHELLRRCPTLTVPLRLAELRPAGASSVICFDLSCFGDPLHRRSLRVPFSLYGKAAGYGYHQPIVCLPTQGLDTEGLLKLRVQPSDCADWAGQTSAAIPGGDGAMLSLVDAYLNSPLCGYHREFYLQHQEERTYPLTSLDSLPPCIRAPLESPNDLLLKPAVLQNLVRCLTIQGWRAAEVWRLVSSRLEQDYGWRAGVHFHEAGCRSEFYTRLFGGLMQSGHDRLDDFDCLSMQARGLCPTRDCHSRLSAARWRQQFATERSYDPDHSVGPHSNASLTSSTFGG